MKGRSVQGLLIVVLCVSAIRAWTDQQLCVRELLQCKSFAPETEKSFVHIGGGFFAYFNRRDGIAKQDSSLSPANSDLLPEPTTRGGIRFTLQKLGYESRLVYRPEGSLVLKTAEGRTLFFTMKVLDYVQVSGSELPFYRLTAGSDEKDQTKAILICCAVGTETPVLVGTLFLVSDSGRSVCGYGIEIRGRNGVEAEDHLWKVVERASHF
jgi:hypothetical protein